MQPTSTPCGKYKSQTADKTIRRPTVVHAFPCATFYIRLHWKTINTESGTWYLLWHAILCISPWISRIVNDVNLLTGNTRGGRASFDISFCCYFITLMSLSSLVFHVTGVKSVHGNVSSAGLGQACWYSMY